MSAGRLKHVRRVMALLLIIALMMPGESSFSFAGESYEDQLDGWKVECMWSGLTRDLEWLAADDGTGRFRLIFTYRMENAQRDYPPGSLTVEIPGIGNACRTRVVPAAALPSDAEDSEWDCSWDENADMYRFTNRFGVEEGQSVNGGFEVLWELGGREVQNGYVQQRSPGFYVDGAGSITLRPVGFSVSSLRDRYRVYLNVDRLSAAKYENADPDYCWYEISASFEKDWLARGLRLSTAACTLTLPENTDASDIILLEDGKNAVTPVEEAEGEFKFNFFEDNPGDLGNKNSTFTKRFRLGILKERALGQEIMVRLHLDRLYDDEPEWIREAGEGEIVDAEAVFTADDYGFIFNGLIYSSDLWNEAYEYYKKPPDYYWYGQGDELTHSEPHVYEERLCAADLYRGRTVEFVFLGTADKDYSSSGPAYLSASPSDAVRLAGPAAATPSNASPSDAMFCSSPVLRAGEDEEYSMVIGNDEMAVFLKDGSIRPLEPEEYEFTYVAVPSNVAGYDYEIYTAPSKDIPFEEYVRFGGGNLSSSKTFSLPEGTRAFYIRINGVTGSFQADLKAGVRLHADWQREQEKDLQERIDHENRIVSFSFLRILCKDADGTEKNDCKATAGEYTGTYGEELAARDYELYGEYLLRDYSNVWLRPVSTTLKADAGLSFFEPNGKDSYSAVVTAGGSIKADTDGELCSFSIYIVFPDGLNADFYSGPFEVTGSLTSKEGGMIDHPEDHVSFSEGYYLGRKMIRADLDFRGDPLKAQALNRINIYLPVTLSYADYPVCGDSYTVRVYLMVNDEGVDKITGPAITTDEYDINQNGVTTEKMAYASADRTIEKEADEWREYVSKYVKSAYSDGFSASAATRRFRGDDDQKEAGSLYEYRLDFGLGSSAASGIVFFDNLEQGAVYTAAGQAEKAESEWQGEFCSVDTSYAESRGLKPTVYYSRNADEAFSLTSAGWSRKMPEDASEVKSIAVELDTSGLAGGVLNAKDMVYVLVKMCAPGSVDLLEKQAVNQYTVKYDSFGLNGEAEGSHILPSAHTKLKLLESVGGFILEKTDADNIIRVDAEGVSHYAALTGGTFQIYDDMGKALFDSPQGLDPLGRIVVKDIAPGTYYWEEISAPAGYERIPGKHAFLAEGTLSTITVENRRIPASVTLRKHDQDDPERALLSGAAFELTKSNGDRVFTDATYSYDEEGENSVFVTGEDGTFTITGLPWGNYTFSEITAPEGYEVSLVPLTFTAGKDSYDEESGRIAVFVDAYDYEKTASLRLLKSDSINGEGIPGAVYSLYRAGDENGEDICVASGLKTGAEGGIEVNGLKFGTYYFKETLNPGGYLMPEPEYSCTDTITLDAGTVDKVLKIDHSDERMRGSVLLRKCDDTGRPVGGAVFDLFGVSGGDVSVPLGSYVTGDDKDEDNYGEIYVDDLEWGEYYFTETKTPRGYELSPEKIPFVVDRETVQNTVEIDVVNERMRGSVKLLKTDRNDPEKILPGAVFMMYHNSGEPCVAGVDYQLPEGVDSIITGEDGSITLTGLKQGAYFLKEVTAPDPYSLSAETIRFSVTMENAELVQELRIEDERGMAVLTLDKEVNDVCEAFGNPTFIFKITRSDGAVYFAPLTLSPAVLSGSVSLNVEQGYVYTVEETGVSRYVCGHVEPVKNAVADDEQMKAVADLFKNDEAEIRFYNTEEQYEKFSHSADMINTVKSSARLTALTVEYTGPDPITDDLPGFDKEQEIYIIPHDDLYVRAYYDDGSSEVLSDEDYMLMPVYADGNSDSYTGTVSFFRNGVQKAATFSFNISLPAPDPRSLITYELNGGMIVPPGQSSAVDTYILRVKTGTSIERPQNDPVRENYSFKGWYTDRALQNAAEFPFAVMKDTVIYAGWEADPVNVRYAVSVYGIDSDTDTDGYTAGLTFGPALGASWLGASRSHEPSAGQLCLHSMTWDEIAAQSINDPEVFRECMQNGCTHAVDLTIRGALAEGVTPLAQSIGDGASVLCYSVNEAYRSWGDADDDPGTYEDSFIRKVLNGGAEGAEYSLEDALPEELRRTIVRKKGLDDAVWLFSPAELYPDIPENLSDGKLYERQDIWGTDRADLKGYAEDAREMSFWLRTADPPGMAYMAADDGTCRTQQTDMAGGIAFGFCLPGPEPSTRLAVSLYGIRHDLYMEKSGEQGIAGLTFGPATGGDYRESFISHTPTGRTTAGNSHRCIHDDDWDTIASWSLKDPYVYEQCFGDEDRESCTKGIDIFLNDTLAGKSFSFNGDGPGVLCGSLSKSNHSFGYTYGMSDVPVNDGGWPASRIRAVLNGADSYTNKLMDGSDALTYVSGKPSAGEDPPVEEVSLFNCLPAKLRGHIVPKAVISDTLYSDKDTTGHTMTTYDRLWLFSAHEIWAVGDYSGIRVNEGDIYERQKVRQLVPSGSDPGLIVYDETGKQKMLLRTIGDRGSDIQYIIYGVSNTGDKCKMRTYDEAGAGFGFCIK